MKLKQTVKMLVAGFIFMVGVATFATVSTPVFAADCDPATQSCCGGVQTSLISCDQTGASGDLKDTGIWGVLLLAINILTAGIGVAAVAGIVYASILYTSSGGDQERIKKAMTIITDIVIGVVAYALMYAALNFLVPGGIFNAPVVTP
jgi:hypothetical protein